MADESTDTSTTDAPAPASTATPDATSDAPTPAAKTVDATGGTTKPEQRTGGEDKTFSQADVNRILQDRLERDRVKMTADVEAKVRQEMAEAQLLEDNKFKELFEVRSKENETLKAQIAEVERLKKVDALLDKKEVVNPRQRALFRRLPGDLTEISTAIDEYREDYEIDLREGISKKLDTKAPPQSATETETKKPSEMTIEEWAAHKKANNIY